MLRGLAGVTREGSQQSLEVDERDPSVSGPPDLPKAALLVEPARPGSMVVGIQTNRIAGPCPRHERGFLNEAASDTGTPRIRCDGEIVEIDGQWNPGEVAKIDGPRLL